jgi:ribosomal protein L9
METLPENVKKAKEAIEAILQEQKVVLVPIIVHQGDQTFSSVDVVSIAEQISEQQVAPRPITPAS